MGDAKRCRVILCKACELKMSFGWEPKMMRWATVGWRLECFSLWDHLSLQPNGLEEVNETVWDSPLSWGEGGRSRADWRGRERSKQHLWCFQLVLSDAAPRTQRPDMWNSVFHFLSRNLFNYLRINNVERACSNSFPGRFQGCLASEVPIPEVALKALQISFSEFVGIRLVLVHDKLAET